jgi:esterase/lipase superfamily enzyme
MLFTRIIILIPQILVLSACSSAHVLVDTPNLYVSSQAYPSQDIAEGYATTRPELFFVTDRRVKSSDNVTHFYGTDRSSSIAFGTVEIQFGQDLSWDALEAASITQSRDNDILLNVVDINEIVRFPEIPLPFRVENGRAVILPDSVAAYETAIRSMQIHLQERLVASKQKDIILYMHGVNTEFNDAALNLADVWHFTGRHGVPIFYSWPAANEGMFGYFKDRESGEFSIYHVKETIRILASTPGLEKLHIIAHSRGTDIITTALRELVIEFRAAGNNPRDVLKIENLILAAPDLDFGVVRQRLIAEKFGLAIGQLTVYMNQDDGALGLSQYLMAGLRFGKLSQYDLDDSDKVIFQEVKNVSFVSVEGVSSFLGHSYYKNHPGVLSDIAILVRQNLKPGDEGRPLIHQQINFWTLPENYP